VGNTDIRYCGFRGATIVNNVESWNGTSWSEIAEVNTARQYSAGLGATSASGLLVAGYTTTQVGNVESWDGSSWTEITDVNTARYQLNSSGTDSSGIVFAGDEPNKAVTEFWNGTSWTEVADLATARYGPGGSSNGTSNLALAFGGNATPGVTGATEEWTVPEYVVKTFTTS
jgi:hypothetical protein